MRTTRIVLLLLAFSTPVAAKSPADSSRFSGGGSLSVPAAASSDGRFALAAELRAGAASQSAGRYTVNAQLKAGVDAKAVATSCAGVGVDIFKNGFE